ncbi:MAG: hypothetical protein V4805_09180 [Pseudomonadota bacterium]
MANSITKNWSDVSADPISEDAIRALHQPAAHFSVYANVYGSGEKFTLKAGHNFVLYVLIGACRSSIDGQDVQVEAGQLMALDMGSYQFEAVGADGVRLVKVFGRL